ncbi:MAG: response regulator [Candidatus Yonathbacteria bacterium]|nr:response regulator [Candidatus Yonathbacteria bacterium]
MTDFARTSHTILVADDETPLRKALALALTHAGYTVVEAANGQDAITAANAQRPSLVILDVFMPGMDGRAVLRELRSREDMMHTPVILLTNMSDISYVAEATAYPGVDYVVKSDWDIADIVKKVDERLTPQT